MQPRNNPYSGAQGVIFLEGSSAISDKKVEGIAQPAGCSTTARTEVHIPAHLNRVFQRNGIADSSDF